MPSAQLDFLGLGGSPPPQAQNMQQNSYSVAPASAFAMGGNWGLPCLKCVLLTVLVIVVIMVILAWAELVEIKMKDKSNFTLYQNADKAMAQLSAMEGAGVARNIMTEGYSSEYPTNFTTIDKSELQSMI